jgi:signal transduction histidine kinase
MTGVHRVWLLIAVSAAAAVGIYEGSVVHLDAPIASPDIHWGILAASFYLAEVFVVQLDFRHNPYSFSLSEIPLALGLFFATPGETVLGQMVGAALALALVRKLSPIKTIFNVVTFALQGLVAAWVFHSILGVGDPLGPPGWIAAFVALGVWGLVQYLMIGMAISLTSGRLELSTMVKGIDIGMAITASNTGLGLLAVTVLAVRPWAAWLLCVPIGAMYFAYRAYTSERRKHETLESLYDASRSAHRSLQIQESMNNVLSQSLKMFAADQAKITLFPSNEGEPFFSSTLDSSGRFEYMVEERLDPKEGVWARVAAEDKVIMVAKPIESAKLRAYYSKIGVRDEIVAPLHAAGEVSGVMHVSNRRSEVNTFTAEDIPLLATLASHASLSLENARLVSELQESLDHLTEMNQLKDDFVASVSHELRTPLTSITGYVKTLLRPDAAFDEAEKYDFLRTIERQSQRLHRLIEDLLSVSRIESQQLAPQIDRVDLGALLDEVLDELRSKVRGHKVEVELEDDLPFLETDPGKVHQVLANLIENALKYSPEGSVTTVRARPDSGGVTVEVIDQGEGVPPNRRDAIFDRFYQIDQTATRRVGGAGLGLYICRRLAEAVEGRVWLERTGDDGSTFAFWIPEKPALVEIAT